VKLRIYKTLDLVELPGQLSKEFSEYTALFLSLATQMENIKNSSTLILDTENHTTHIAALASSIDNIRRALYKVDTFLEDWHSVLNDINEELTPQESPTKEEESDH